MAASAVDKGREVPKPENAHGLLLEVRDLHTWFTMSEGVVRAVDGVDLELGRGRTLGIVGESGSGKTMLSLSILRLVPEPQARIVKGSVMFEGTDLLRLDAAGMRRIRGNRISMVFQEPMTSLNPVFTIGSQVAEVLLLHRRAEVSSYRDALPLVTEMLARVGMENPGQRVHDYPHQLSGGMRQRVMIAMAMACRPSLLIADEPTSALDVTTQGQILALMEELKETTGTSIMFVTHDLAIVSGFCQEVAVMYTGRVLESSSADMLFAEPLHPYTKGLLRSVPRLGCSARRSRLKAIDGSVPTFRDMPSGCTFHPRCREAMDLCRREEPPVVAPEAGRKVRCWRYSGA
jgi:peptide/nickel transport system ATP-binding protein/oligopeptide transport system ATP-binding protein